MINEIIAALGEWAVATDGVQWILQKRAGAGWRPISFVRSTKAILARCMREYEVELEVAQKLLASLPEYFDPIFDENLHTTDFKGRSVEDRGYPDKLLYAAPGSVIAGEIRRSDWKPCNPAKPIADDLTIPQFLRRHTTGSAGI